MKIKFLSKSASHVWLCLKQSLQADPADGGDHGGEREQDHHLRGDQEKM